MARLVRICGTCGNKNSLEKQLCSCGSPLFMVIPTEDESVNDVANCEKKLIKNTLENVEKESEEKVECGMNIDKESEEELVNNVIAEKEPRKYRRCKVCGTINYIDNGKDVNKCQNPNCSNDELYRSVLEEEKPTVNAVELHLKNGNKIIRITSDVVLGREGDVERDFFKNFDEVSRTHCSIFCVNNQWYVKDCKSLNHTYINGRLMEIEEEKLNDGDELSIWKLHFEVKIGEK